MGRKKKAKDEDDEAEDDRESARRREDDDSDSSDSPERRHYDIDPDIQEFAYAFSLDAMLTQRLNDIMIEKRSRTWEQDLERLDEILRDARAPAVVLKLKLRDMEKGTFAGKARCGTRVRELAKKHRLDKGASIKLEEAMSMREAMGKDIDKDLDHLDEHLAASNAPSKLISMKLESMRKGFNIGRCIYSREPMQGNQGPGVEGVFNKRERRQLGYTDADLDKRFGEQIGGRTGGTLMDEETIRKMMKKERQKHEAEMEKEEARQVQKNMRRSPSRGRPATRSRSRSVKKKRSKGSSSSRSPKGKKGQSKKSPKKRSPSRAKRRKSRSKSPKRKRSRSRSCSRSKKRKASRGRSASRKKKT